MSDALLYACRECNNAVVSFTAAPPEHDCPACGENPEDLHGMWVFVEMIR